VTTFAAVDLGASSGRVMLASVGPEEIELTEVHRFPNRPVTVRGTLHWDALALWAGVIDGLRVAGRTSAAVAGIGVDSWAVDYGLLDEDGQLLGNPVHYRDRRTEGVSGGVAATMTMAELYTITGVQVLPFNTVFQLMAARGSWAMRHAARALLIPDLFGYWLTGEVGSELTNASTTGLLDVHTKQWSDEVAKRLRIRDDLFPAIRQPGDRCGLLLPAVAAECELGRIPVTAVASHDTASAVLGVPARDENFAYISCGTWSLVGVELSEPVTSEAARAANFSNELGVDGTVRFLRNVMGLWLLQESVRTWQRGNTTVDLAQLLAEAATVQGGRSVVDPDRPEFLAPGDMPDRLRAECRRTREPVPVTPPEITRCILDSLAVAHRRAIQDAAALSGRSIEVVHLVGGGAQNALLCQLTADACAIPVIAGPVEATAYGNVLVQARSAGVVDGDLAALRRLIDPHRRLRRFEPSGSTAMWHEAQARLATRA
jgi:rhamnulokinase